MRWRGSRACGVGRIDVGVMATDLDSLLESKFARIDGF